MSTIGLAAATASRRPVLISVSPDPTMVRPRNYCVMNPFRDRSPEQAADRLLSNLRAGDLAALAKMNVDDHILENEQKWPVVRWRIGRRNEESDRTELMFWVVRGNGYMPGDYEEEVYVTVRGKGPSAVVTGFAAVY